MKFVILMGLVSLFADITYEGARSISGAFLATFGISALMLGFFSGIGELFSYSIRIFSGLLADKTRKYWFMTFLGYSMVFAIPAIYFANSWQLVVLLLLLERLGKALRSPSRDALISFSTSKIGHGKGFGLHEALDQIGAIIGPIIVFFAIFFGFSYHESFGFLLIPSFLMIIALFLAKKEYTSEEIPYKRTSGGLDREIYYYMAFSALSLAGFANFQLIAYHFEIRQLFDREIIPILYAIAMGVDALSALIAGRFYDKFGLNTLFLIPILTPLSVLFTLSLSPVFGVVLYGIVLGMQESIARAGVAELSSESRRATSYGIFNAANGLGFFFGGITLGFLYDLSLEFMFTFSFFVEFIAVLFLVVTLKRVRKK